MSTIRSRIDLHMHSNVSDGTLSPSALVDAANRGGLVAVALTDHDSLGGCGEFVAAGERERIDAIPGVELSCEVPGRTCHMLGYFLMEGCSPLSETLKDVRRHRENRNSLIAERLRGLGVDISLQEVEELAQGGVAGRNHFARCLIRKGVVDSVQAAFDRYLARGRLAYVDRKRLSPEEACRQILASGGLPVLAHPAQLNFQVDQLRSFVKGLVDGGLCGIEVFYSRDNPSHVHEELQIAKDCGLIATAGSDYHGTAKSHIVLGGTGCPWPDQNLIVDRLREKLKAVREQSES